MIDISARVPRRREDGTLIGAARHRSREATVTACLNAALSTSVRPPFVATSAWVNHYRVGDYAAIHRDRPDADITALLALDKHLGPLVICEELVGIEPGELLKLARRSPFPAGRVVQLIPRQFLLLRGALVPHHRPRVTRAGRVLAVTLTLDPGARWTP